MREFDEDPTRQNVAHLAGPKANAIPKEGAMATNRLDEWLAHSQTETTPIVNDSRHPREI